MPVSHLTPIAKTYSNIRNLLPTMLVDHLTKLMKAYDVGRALNIYIMSETIVGYYDGTNGRIVE